MEGERERVEGEKKGSGGREEREGERKGRERGKGVKEGRKRERERKKGQREAVILPVILLQCRLLTTSLYSLNTALRWLKLLLARMSLKLEVETSP